MKSLWQTIKAKYYFIPALYVLSALLLITIAHILENEQLIPRVLTTSVSYGDALLPMMIGSIVTLMTITFSLMMVVLTMYGAQFSPRTLQDFLSSKQSQHVLGFLIGTSIYAVINFYLIHDFQARVITPMIATVLFILSILLFAYFIYYVSKNVQITSYVRRLVKTIDHTVEKRHQEVLDNPDILYQKEVTLEKILDEKPNLYKAQKSGYVIGYQLQELKALAEEYKCVLITKKQVGQYVLEEDALIAIHQIDSVDEELHNRIADCISISSEAKIDSTFDSGTKKLVEIAVKALSPGINDPETSRFCISNLGFILQKLSTILAHTVYQVNGEIRLVSRQVYFTKVLYDHFAEIKLYGFNNFSIITETVKSLTRIAQNTDYEQNQEIWKFVHYLLDDVDLTTLHEYDLSPIHNAVDRLAEHLEVENDLSDEKTA
ncbi:MAG: DUF2254 family protein [Candidatus Izemoplasma sp.]|nr:DUF2254 family protein [Candidatus Izemoplasma sp.]